MMRDAEQYADEDRRRKEEADVRNNADTLAYSTEKFIKDNADKLSDDLKKQVGDEIVAVKAALSGTDTDAIKAAAEKLATVNQKMGAAMYAQHQNEAGPDGQAGAPHQAPHQENQALPPPQPGGEDANRGVA